MTSQYNAQGIPPLLNTINNVANIAILLVADGLLIASKFLSKAQWGIFSKGTFLPAIIPDSIVSFDFKKEYRLANYPQEEGAFQSYNKVTMPYDARIVMTKGGSLGEREYFLSQCVVLAGSLDLYTIVTPEITYINANIESYNYRRTSTNGVTLLTVEFLIKEVRITVPEVFSNTAQPTAATQTDIGYVQTSIIPSNALSQIKGAWQ